MTNRISIFCLSAVFLSIVSTAVVAQAPLNGVFQFQDVNVPGAIETDTFAVNNTGAIAGDFVDVGGAQHGMILKGTQVTSFDFPPCPPTPPNATAAYGINSAGAVVGWCVNTSSVTVAFERLNGNFKQIIIPGATFIQATGINDVGAIVGTYKDSFGKQHGFLLAHGNLKTLDVSGATATIAWGINNAGLITVEALATDNTFHSYLYNGTTFKKIDVPGAVNSLVHDINRFGDRIYTVIDSVGNEQGFFFLNIGTGHYYGFHDPNDGHTTKAYGINDTLEIIGDYTPGMLTHPATPPNQGFSARGCCRGDSQ